MHLDVARWLRSRILDAQFIWRNIECRYLAAIANGHTEYMELLVLCVGSEFGKHDAEVSGYGWHTQPLPGYTMHNGKRTSEICWEAPVCIIVYRNDVPIVGMAVEFRGHVLCIRQLQGAPNSNIPKNLKQWPKLFVQAAQLFLLNTKEITSLRLYSATERPSYRHPQHIFSKDEMQAYRQNLRRRYDGTARQSGMKRVNTRYWEWNLSYLPKSRE